MTTTAFGASSVFVADIDGDMEVDDIVTAESISFIVAWYERIPATDPDTGEDISTYTRHVIANSVDDTSSAIAEDMDGDGDMDVVATAPGEAGDRLVRKPRRVASAVGHARGVGRTPTIRRRSRSGTSTTTTSQTSSPAAASPSSGTRGRERPATCSTPTATD